MEIAKVIEYLDLQYDLKQEIAELIGYGSELDCAIEDCRLKHWYIDGKDRLMMFSEKPPANWYTDDWLDNADYWEYTISSYAARGERFFQGEQDRYTFIMAYFEDGRTNDANVLVFRNSRKIKNL